MFFTALAFKTLPVKQVPFVAEEAINFIRGSAHQHMLLKPFCEEAGTKHTVLLFHTQVKWLSWGHVLIGWWSCY